MWLLANALRSLPLDRAIELERRAEAFVTGSSGVEHVSDRRSDVEASEMSDEGGSSRDPSRRPPEPHRLNC
jgi:hypothetical protein